MQGEKFKMREKDYTNICGILENLYEEAKHFYYENKEISIDSSLKSYLDVILSRVEQNKGVLSVLITLLVYKLYNPSQNIKLHRAEFEGGFSGRTLDTKCVTPFMKSKDFPAMKESGWLTRSLEQPHPYDFNYPGKITPKEVKQAFLYIVHEVEDLKKSPKEALLYIFNRLLDIKETTRIKLPRPRNLTIDDILDKLKSHFTHPYASRGRSRLPVLALYAIYRILVKELERYDNKRLADLLPHESPDDKTGMLGDIQVMDMKGKVYEVVEVKDRTIDYGVVLSALEKIRNSPPDRYYILTTHEYAVDERIRRIINQTRSIYGTTLIINGVMQTIKYYLRLVRDPSDFIELYVELLEKDASIKREHKEVWMKLFT